ncbi:MAG: hypothetical protein HUU10_13880 [Bacteroidetes bacterium]|nr:hypothetical protein [Bacteroidota bacterium]
MRFPFFLVLTTLGVFSLTAQPVRLTPPLHLNAGQSVILDVRQDSAGFIWAATQDGLSRFDGVQWTTWRRSSTDLRSFSDNWFNRIAEAEPGVFWLATEAGGLNRLDVPADSIRFWLPDSLTGLTSPVIRDVVISPNRSLILATWGQGVASFDETSNRFRYFRSGLSDPFVRHLLAVQDGIWVSTRSGLNFLGWKDTSFQSWLPSRDVNRPDTDFIVETTRLDDRFLAVATRTGLLLFNTQTNRFSSFGPTDWKPLITTLTVDRSGRLWAGTYDQGIRVFNRNGEELCWLKAETGHLKVNYIRRVLEDRDGNVWVGTWGGGLTLFRPDLERFQMPEGLAGSQVRSFFQDASGRLWAGRYKEGLAFSDGETWKPTSGGKRLPDVLTVTADFNGTLWAGGNQGVATIDPVTRKETPWPLSSRIPGAIRKLVWVSADQLWILSNSGWYTWQPSTGTLINSGEQAGLKSRNAEHLLFINDSTVWMAFRNEGITELIRRPAGWKPTQTFTYRPDDLSSLSANTVLDLIKDASDHIWVATTSGLNRFDQELNGFTRFGSDAGLPNEVIYSLRQDRFGWFWAGTNLGLVRFRPESDNKRPLLVTVFDHTDGLPSDEFNTAAALVRANGTLLFGTITGPVSFDPSRFNEPTQPPSVGLVSVLVGNRPVNLREKDGLTIGYLDKILDVRAAVLRYNHPERHRFSWRLEGFQSGWSVPSSESRFVFTNLDPGDYTLQIRGADHAGQWSVKPVDLRFRVLPPFYMTWWFRLLAVLLIIGIPFLLLLNRLQKLKAVEQLRMQIARDLHDDVGAQLTRVNMQANLLAAQVQPDQREQQAQRLIDDSQAVLRTMSDVIWSIDAGKDTVGDWIGRIRSAAESLTGPVGIHLDFREEGWTHSDKMDIRLRQNLYLLVKEAVNNAVKHSGSPVIRVHLIRQGNRWSILVADEGKGLPESPGRGNGLKNMTRRAQAIGATLTFIRQNGTHVVIAGDRFP